MKIIEPQTAEEWEKYYELRWRILRAPWNEPRGSEVDAADKTSVNIMILSEENFPVAVGRLHLNSPEEGQVRFVAVEKNLQGKGYGKILMNVLEERAKNSGAKKIVLHARDNAVEFYKRLGYCIVEKSYLLFGEIQHYLMEKNL